ncbi:MAG TPA: hypothetical protein VJS37_16470 [Terriglobales bacterium]|nr:hypothetical protein [Terriglobales bacterium]
MTIPSQDYPYDYTKHFVRTVYVFLHGLICLIDVGKLGFVAHMLDVGDAHKYLCGNWLLERDIKAPRIGRAPVRMQLVGVEPGNARLDEGLNFIVKLSSPPNYPQTPVRAIITLPRPRHIYHFNQGGIRETSCTENFKSRFIRFPTVVSGLRVFEYRFRDFTNVALTDEYGRCVWDCPPPAPIPEIRRVVSTLHIYDEPAEELPASHNLQEFNTSLKFLGVLDCELLDSNTDAKINDLILPGVLPGETSTLDSRDPAVLQLLFQARRNELFEGLEVGGGAGGPVCGGVNGIV